jgi:hypothetical protein
MTAAPAHKWFQVKGLITANNDACPLSGAHRKTFARSELYRFDLACVKTLRGMTAPEILRLVVTLRAKKCKNSPFARHYDQIRFRFRTAKTLTGHRL